MPLFGRVTIVGVGLLGGSLGMAMRRRGLAREVVGVARVPGTIAAAAGRGAVDRGTVDPAEGVLDADLVVLATPPELIVPMARRVLPHLVRGAILTDVASVKAEVVAPIEALVRAGSGVEFVGGHPMAGNEGRGIAAAAADLFEGSVYVITPTARTAPDAVQRLSELARGLGAAPIVVDPATHDRMVAVVSHLPYLIAAALVAAASGGVERAAGPSFLGATRVAGSSIEMWTQICRLNREAIADAIETFRSRLGDLEGALGDPERLGALLARAAEARRQVDAARRAALGAV
jgi:prephenate dehydrogenase